MFSTLAWNAAGYDAFPAVLVGRCDSKRSASSPVIPTQGRPRSAVETNMYIDAIRDAVANEDRTAIRAAFRALVGFPYEAPILGNGPAGKVGIDELMKALDAVCEAVEGDDTIVPRTTIEFINGRVTTPPIPGGSSYGEAAELVADQREQWRQGFLAHIAFHL